MFVSNLSHCNLVDLYMLHCNLVDLYMLHCNLVDLYMLHCDLVDFYMLHCNLVDLFFLPVSSQLWATLKAKNVSYLSLNLQCLAQCLTHNRNWTNVC